MELKIGDKSYPLRYGIRAQILFEKMAGKPFSLQDTTDWTIFIYAMMLAGTPDAEITLNEFINGVELIQFNEAIAWAAKQMEIQSQLSREEKDVKKKQ